jgi:hypothetical protein
MEWMSSGRLCAALSALLMLASAATADELDLFNAAVEDFSAHNRAALGYLRTENLELGALEMERMKASWGALTERFGGNPPRAFRDNPRFATTLVDVPTRLVGGFLMLQMRRPDLARDALVGIRKEISELRRSSQVEVLADCIIDANAAMDALFANRDKPPDLAAPDAAAELANKAEAYGATVRRCDGMAASDVRNQPEFRRLVDGITASLALIPKAVAERDGDLLHRLLIELRSFDNLLAFRYG